MAIGDGVGIASIDFGGHGTLVVEELLDGGKGYASGPERGLMSAILFDGVQSFMSYVCATEPSVKERYKEAYSWITRREKEYVFSFESVCESLGLDAEYLRLGLINAANSKVESWRRARRNF
jgi:hypothetical protein